MVPATVCGRDAFLRKQPDGQTVIYHIHGIGKQGGTATELTRQSALDEALCFGWIDSTQHPLDEQRRLVSDDEK